MDRIHRRSFLTFLVTIGYWERLLVSIASIERCLRQSWGSISCRTQIKHKVRGLKCIRCISNFFHGKWRVSISLFHVSSSARVNIILVCLSILHAHWEPPDFPASRVFLLLDSWGYGLEKSMEESSRKLWFSRVSKCPLVTLHMQVSVTARGANDISHFIPRWGTLRALTHTLRAKVRDLGFSALAA